MSLPDCFTNINKIDPGIWNAMHGPKRFYEVILSRKAHGMRISETKIMFWSSVVPVRCILTRQALDARIDEGYRACILREFDHA